MMIHYCNRLIRWQLHNIQPLRTFFQSGNVKNALRLYITCIETQGENSNCAVPLYFTRNPCAPHRPVTADDRLCLLGYSKTLLSTGCSRTSSAASFRCLTPSGSSLETFRNLLVLFNAFFILDCLSVDVLYVIIPFCNLQGFFQNFSEYFLA